jgi:hypothetical protein
MTTQVMLQNLATEICIQQDKFTSSWHSDPENLLTDGSTLMIRVIEQHRFNFDLWHEEDRAREPGADNATIAGVKGRIDSLNQQRNDMVTVIDEYLDDRYFSPLDNSLNRNSDIPWNSETIGSIIDRLSIASLKNYHMHEQTERPDVDATHIASCALKFERLVEQQNDLALALQCFIDDIFVGKKQNKLYRQFKMYNDPTLNPKIYGQTKPN